MIPSTFTTPPVRFFKRTIPAGQTAQFDVFGAVCVVKECEYQPEIAFDDGDFMPWDLALSIDFQKYGFTFNKVRIRNPLAVSNTVEIFVGFFDLADRRLNIVEGRNGSAASEVPLAFSEMAHTFTASDAGEAVMFDGTDYNRAEIWLVAETFGTVWFGADEATMNGVTAEADFRRVGLAIDGFTKLKTKAPVWIRGNEGATVRAFVFSF